jgi:hypothetical protein
MATTTNYSWSTPDDTDLVKDGAAAIRTLGSSIDTTTKALNPSTTLGDIEYRSSSANTNTRLGIGTTGQILTVAGGVPSWATSTAGGFTELASANLPAASTVTISGISGSYRDLRLIVRDANVGAVNEARICYRFNSDTGSNYFTISTYPDSVTSATSVERHENFDQNATGAISELTIQNYADTTVRKLYNRADIGPKGDGSVFTSINFGGYNSTTAITSITIFDLSGNSFAAGNYLLLGLK